MNLGDKILKLRKNSNLSQEQLGDKIGVTRQTISNWELGSTSPSPEQLKKLSKIFNVTTDELLDDKDIVNPSKKSKNNIIIIIVILLLIPILIIGIGCFTYLNKKVENSENKEYTEEIIYCSGSQDEVHSYYVKYENDTNIIIERDNLSPAYFSEITLVDDYEEKDELFVVIKEGAKRFNGETCEIINYRDHTNLIDISIKEDTLTNTKATIIVKNNSNYAFSFDNSFGIRKLKYDRWKSADIIDEQFGFLDETYTLKSNESLELEQDWTDYYGQLPKGKYRLLKTIYFAEDSAQYISNELNIWIEFEIE